jgi:hypothetical protein
VQCCAPLLVCLVDITVGRLQQLLQLLSVTVACCCVQVNLLLLLLLLLVILSCTLGTLTKQRLDTAQHSTAQHSTAQHSTAQRMISR